MSIQVKDGNGSLQTVQTLPNTGQATSANSLPVVVASDQSAIPTAPTLSTSGGWTPKLLNGLGASVTQIKAGAGQLGMLEGYNTSSSAQAYLQVFDAASPGAVTLGATTPVLSIPIAPGGTGGFTLSGIGVQFSNGIQVAATTTATGSTAASVDANAAFH